MSPHTAIRLLTKDRLAAVIIAFATLLLLPVLCAADNRLRFLEFLRDGENGIDGVAGLYHISITDDGRHLYTAGVIGNKVGVFERNLVTGAATQLQTVVLDATGAPSGFASATMNLLSRDQNDLYIAAYYGNKIYHYRRNPTTGLLTFGERIGPDHGDPDVDGLVYLREAIDGRFLYANCLYSNGLAIYSRNTTTGVLTFVNVIKSTDLAPSVALGEPVHIEMSPDGLFLYILGSSDNSVAVFSLNTTTGQPTLVQSIVGGSPGPIERLVVPRWIYISSDGNFAYVTAQGFLPPPVGGKGTPQTADGAIFTFSRNTTTGLLTFQDSYFNVGDLLLTRCFILSPDGTLALANGYDSGATVQFRRDTITGQLTYQKTYRHSTSDGPRGLYETRDIRFSPDGLFVYFGSWGLDGMGIFEVEAGSATGPSWHLYN